MESFRLFAAAFPSLLRQPLLHLCLTTRLPSWKIRPGGASHRTAATSTSGVFWTSSGPRGGPGSSHIGADSPPPRSKRGGSTPKQTDLFQRVCLKGKCPPLLCSSGVSVGCVWRGPAVLKHPSISYWSFIFALNWESHNWRLRKAQISHPL